MNKGKDKGRPPVHQVATDMILGATKPEVIRVLAQLYASRAKVPLEGIESLREAFDTRKGISTKTRGEAEQAIAALDQQKKEAQQKEERDSIYRRINDILNSLVGQLKRKQDTLLAEEKIQKLLTCCAGELPGISSAEKKELIQTAKKVKENCRWSFSTGELADQIIENLEEE